MSAVKAIQIAQEQGQTVYTITQENYSQIIPKLSLSSGVMTDIRDNVAVGRTVTVHEKTINYKGWKGSGYIIIDPQTGSGAYLIDGGANGAALFGSVGDQLKSISKLGIAGILVANLNGVYLSGSGSLSAVAQHLINVNNCISNSQKESFQYAIDNLNQLSLGLALGNVPTGAIAEFTLSVGFFMLIAMITNITKIEYFSVNCRA